MTISVIIPFVMAMIWSALPVQQQLEETGPYGASATFSDGECWFWTGDVGLTASQFESDLKDRFDRKRGIIISYAVNTPVRCIERGSPFSNSGWVHDGKNCG